MAKFEKKLKRIKKNVDLIVKHMFPLSDEVREYWTAPNTLTEFSLGYEQGSVFMRYRCGEAIGDEFPHNNAADCGEFYEKVEEAFEDLEFDMEADEDLLDDLGIDENEFYEQAELISDSLIIIALNITLAKLKSQNKMNITIAEECVFNVYNDYDDGYDGNACSPLLFHEFENNEIVKQILKPYFKDMNLLNFIINQEKSDKGNCSADLILNALKEYPEIEKIIFK